MHSHQPVVVDLDGTLLSSDLLVESIFAYVKTYPLKILMPFKWLIWHGKAHLKKKLAEAVPLDVENLPYNSQVLALIEKERLNGRQIILATASHIHYATQVSNHLKCFDSILATEGNINLSGKNKRDALLKLYGEKGFDYIGNSRADLSIWAVARHAYLVNPRGGVLAQAKKSASIKEIMLQARPSGLLWIKALRLHQWIKNLLIFVPLLASHHISQLNLILSDLLAFIFFGLCASSVYILNDLVDLKDDRHHKKKRLRPFASGHLAITNGLLISIALLVTAFLGASILLPIAFTATLAIYYFITFAYSFSLKKIVILDVITLATLYTMRIISGALAIEIKLTFWILAFSMFIFLSLAFLKRYAELREATVEGKIQKISGRGYHCKDIDIISSLGSASGYLSVLVLALYIQDQDTMILYQHPKIIWLACPLLLFWIGRLWLIAHRGEMHEDPVLFSIRDRVSLLIALLFMTIFWLAT